jgi:hypothetical protein
MPPVGARLRPWRFWAGLSARRRVAQARDGEASEYERTRYVLQRLSVRIILGPRHTLAFGVYGVRRRLRAMPR